MPRYFICEIWLMTKEHNRFATWDSAQSLADVRPAAEHIVNTSEPESCAFALYRNALVAQYLDSCNLERAGDMVGICKYVVIAQNRHQTVATIYSAQQTRTGIDCVRCPCSSVKSFQKRHGNEVSHQNDQIGFKLVGHVYSRLNCCN